MLTDDRLEQIKAKALFVSAYDANLNGVEELFAILEADAGEDEKARAAASIRQKYASASTATPFTFAISPNSIDPSGTASLIQSVSAPSTTSASTFTGISAKNSATGVIAIPGWVRERAVELMFDSSDEDEPSIIDMTVSAVAKLPIDLRRVMCENILVSGGTAMLPGFANRFRTQLAAAVEEAEQSGGMLSIDRHLRQRKGTHHHEEVQEIEVGSKLHKSIAVLNDPWPDMANIKAKEGGSAPAFASNLLPWMGASLAGALKTTSLNAISREAYDEATKSLQESGQEAVANEAGDQKEDGAKDSSKDNPSSAASTNARPNMLGRAREGPSLEW